MMDGDVDLTRWRARLEGELSALDAATAATRDDRAPVELDQQSVGRLARMDAMQMQAMAAATERRRRQQAVRLQAALRRVKTGEFGWCEACGGRIPDGRLDIDPAAARCVGCAAGTRD